MAAQPYAKPYSGARPLSELTIEVRRLLGNYPNLSEDELAVLIELYPRVPLIDIALLSADEQVGDKLDSFHHEHVARMPPTMATLAAFLWFPALLVAGVIFWAVG